MYADDLAVTTQSTDFAPIEETLTSSLDGMSEYYTTNQLRANPIKAQVSLFQLRNSECGSTQLNISWNEVNLAHCNFPYNIGVTLYRTLSYKSHNYREDQQESRNNKQPHPQNKNLKMGTYSNRTQVVRSSVMLFSCSVCLPGVGTLHPCKETGRDTGMK